MVQEFGEQISACLERADQCRDAAASEADERVRQQLQTWNRSGNRSPKAISVSRGSNVSLLDRSLPPEVEKLPKDFPPE